MDHTSGKWAKEIVEFQNCDGTWGLTFHSMSHNQKSSKKPLTTEQALFRLKALGFDINDEPIRKAVECMKACLREERRIDDYWEKIHDWPLFTKLMLSTWVKIFDSNDDLSLGFAKKWADIIEHSFSKGSYDHDAYVNAYTMQFGKKPRGGREIDFVDFYHVSLLQKMLSSATENLLLDYIISKPGGIYYIYQKQVQNPPTIFSSKEASRYLGALELLAGYSLAKDKLDFAINWLYENCDENGQWDFGPKANDGAYFPLSDSWRKIEDRKADCTERVTAFLQEIGA